MEVEKKYQGSYADNSASYLVRTLEGKTPEDLERLVPAVVKKLFNLIGYQVHKPRFRAKGPDGETIAKDNFGIGYIFDVAKYFNKDNDTLPSDVKVLSRNPDKVDRIDEVYLGLFEITEEGKLKLFKNEKYVFGSDNGQSIKRQKLSQTIPTFIDWEVNLIKELRKVPSVAAAEKEQTKIYDEERAALEAERKAREKAEAEKNAKLRAENDRKNALAMIKKCEDVKESSKKTRTGKIIRFKTVPGTSHSTDSYSIYGHDSQIVYVINHEEFTDDDIKYGLGDELTWVHEISPGTGVYKLTYYRD